MGYALIKGRVKALKAFYSVAGLITLQWADNGQGPALGGMGIDLRRAHIFT
jgi:hypothetical protein